MVTTAGYKYLTTKPVNDYFTQIKFKTFILLKINFKNCKLNANLMEFLRKKENKRD